MISLTHKSRALVVTVLLSLAFTSLACRLVQLHVFRHQELNFQAEANREQVVQHTGRRGQIQDCNGNLLANSQSVRIVFADPSITTTQAVSLATKLAPLLQMDVPSLVQRLAVRASMSG